MNTRTKDAIVFSVVFIGGIAFLAGDLHRVILREVWPVITAYLDYLFS